MNELTYLSSRLLRERLRSIGALTIVTSFGVVAGCGGIAVIDGDNSETATPPELAWVRHLDVNQATVVREFAFDDAGNSLAVGDAHDQLGNGVDLAQVKLDTNGTVLWADKVAGPSNSGDQGYDVATIGNDILTLGIVGYQTWVRRSAPDGATLWTSKWPNNDAYRIAVSNDNVILAGSVGEMDASRPWLAIIGKEGNFIGETTTNDPPGSRFFDIGVASSGHIFVSYVNSVTKEVELRRYNGELQLEASVSTDCGGVIAVAPSGNVASVIGGELVGTDVQLCLHDPDFTRLWSTEVTPHNSDYVGAQGIAIDGAGHVLVSGFSRDADTGFYELFVQSHGNADGARRWSYEFSSVQGNFGYGFGVASDGAGQIITGGLTSGIVQDQSTAVVIKLIE